MGQLLKREFELLALNVRLRHKRESTGYIELELATHQGGVAKVRRTWQQSLEELSLPQRLPARGKIPPLKLSPQTLAELKVAIDSSGVGNTEALWLYLMTPYGFLGALDWEAVLVPALGRPVLRLPDFLERPRENDKTFDLAICCSVPDDEPGFDAVSVVCHMASLAAAVSTRINTRVHIFVDPRWRVALANNPLLTINPQVRIYQGSSSVETDPASGWFEWIQEELKGQSLDAVHFISHGNLAGSQPYLAFTESPNITRSRSNASFLSVGDITSFLTQCGAWAALFSAPPSNYSPAGLRLFADMIAQTRPGVVLTHDIDSANWHAGLRAAYAFLFAAEPQRMEARADVALCCPPALVAREPDVEAVAWPVKSPLTLSLDSIVHANGVLLNELDFGLESRSMLNLESLPAPRPMSTPSWLSASQRYFEQAALGVQANNRSWQTTTIAQPTAPRGYERSTRIALDTLKQLQDVVRNVASVQSGRGLSMDVMRSLPDIEKL